MANGSNEKTTQSAAQGAANAATRMKEQVSSATEEAKRRVSDAAQAAVNKADQQRERVAIAFDKTAATLQQHRDKLPDAAQTAAELQFTADYLHEHDVNAMAEDVKILIRRHPGTAVGAAALFGFVLAFSLRRKR